MELLLGVFSFVTLIIAAILLDKKSITKLGITAITAAFLFINVCAYAFVL